MLKGDNVELNLLKDKLMNQSNIIIVLGARGSGKTATGLRLLEDLRNATGKPTYLIGFPEKVKGFISKDTIHNIKHDSLVAIDEAGHKFSARSSMSSANKDITDMINTARHNSLTLIFISQNSTNIDVNIIRQCDILLLKRPSLLQEYFERSVIKKLYQQVKPMFDVKGYKKLVYIFSDQYVGMMETELPTFWNEDISTAYKKALSPKLSNLLPSKTGNTNQKV